MYESIEGRKQVCEQLSKKVRKSPFLLIKKKQNITMVIRNTKIINLASVSNDISLNTNKNTRACL